MINPRDITVFIVDDNDISRSMLKHILINESFNIIGEAAGGVPAIDWLTRNRAHVVCLDIMMPDISGIEILQHIKHYYPDTLVLMVTGDNKREIVLNAVQAGADGFIIKPFNPSTLIEAVYASLRKSSRAQARPARTPGSSTLAKSTPIAKPVAPASATQSTVIVSTKPVRYYPDR